MRKDCYNLYIARANYECKQVLAKPCIVCTTAIMETNISNIFYTTSIGEGEKICLANLKLKRSL